MKSKMIRNWVAATGLGLLVLLVFSQLNQSILRADSLQLVATEPVGARAPAEKISVIALGDIMMHGPVKNSAAAHNQTDPQTGQSINNAGFDFLFELVKEQISAADITIGNMEFPVHPPYGRTASMVFNCRPEIIPAIRDAGVDIVTVANNHLYDQGKSGLISTLSALEQNRLAYIGAGRNQADARRGVVVSRGNLTLGFIGYTGVFNNNLNSTPHEVHVNQLYDNQLINDDIAYMKEYCDFLIVQIHTGVEYRTEPEPRDVRLFRKILDMGADMIIAHHPHVLQNTEIYTTKDGRDCHIFYSLGNFISNQGYACTEQSIRHQSKRTRESIILQFEIWKPSRASDIHPFAANFQYHPIWTLNQLAPGSGAKEIRPLLVNDKIAQLTDLIDDSQSKSTAEAKNQHEYYSSIRAEIFQTLGVE